MILVMQESMATEFRWFYDTFRVCNCATPPEAKSIYSNEAGVPALVSDAVAFAFWTSCNLSVPTFSPIARDIKVVRISKSHKKVVRISNSHSSPSGAEHFPRAQETKG